MINWKLLTDEEALRSWDRTLAGFADCAPYQAYAWGEYRRGLGWVPHRWLAINDRDEVAAMMQAYVRRYPFGVGMVWSEGGPVGDLSICDQRLQKTIQNTTGLKRVYCRFRCDRERDIQDALRLSSEGWRMPWSPITTSYSMWLDLGLEEDRLLAGFSRNWRRNLNRSSECSLTVRQWLGADAEEIHSVYVAMQDLKGLDEQLSREEIAQHLKSLGDQLVLYRCEDESGALLSVMGSLVIGNRAVSVFSATTERGRELHASYAVCWALFRHCRNIGVCTYDLAGIDPVRNPGVYRFKKATGARTVEYLGEWDWAAKPWLRWFGNWAIEKRNRLRWSQNVVKEASSSDRIQVGALPADAGAS